jgi:hypothetical protein
MSDLGLGHSLSVFTVQAYEKEMNVVIGHDVCIVNYWNNKTTFFFSYKLHV